jgi:hypothetical protein
MWVFLRVRFHNALFSEREKMQMTKIHVLAAVAAASLSASVFAAAFTPGDLVVSRIGTGTGALSSAATAVFLDEYTPAGVPVQTIALPTTVNGTNDALTSSGSATSEGALTRSVDGQYLVIAGYNAAPGTAGVAGSASASVARVVGRIDAGGNIDTTTALTDAFTGNNIRSATTIDGTSFWIAGPGVTSNNGIRFATLGATTSTSLNSAAPTNNRIVNIINNQLYTSTGSGTVGIYAIGSGVPTSGPQTPSILTGTSVASGSPYDYVFADPNTLYVADDRSSGTGAGLEKLTQSGGTWTLAYSALDGTAGFRSLTLAGSTLYGITTNNLLVSATDTGSGFTFNTVVTGATNTALRGVDLAPVAAIVPEPATFSMIGIAAMALVSRRRRA